MATAKRENAFEDVALVAGTQQNLRNLYSLDIYGCTTGPQPCANIGETLNIGISMLSSKIGLKC